jgi:predicted dehydrogenase
MKNDYGKTGIGIVGCGYWGLNYVRIFSELPNARVVTVCDQRPERLDEVKRTFPKIGLTTDLRDILQNEEIEAVVISTTASTHYAIAAACLEAGKDVLVEKPLTTIPADAADLIEIAEANSRMLMVGHTFLYNPAVHVMKKTIEEGNVGDLYYLYSRRTNMGPIRQDVNAIWDLAPHDISIFNYLLGSNPLWVSAVGTRLLGSRQEDVGFVTLGYPNGAIGNIHVSWVDPNKVRELVVVGSNKRIVFDDLNTLERVKIFEKGVKPAKPAATSYGEFQFQIRNGAIISPHIEVSEPLKDQCSHFLKSMHNGRQPLTDGRSGLEVVQVLTAIDRSIAYNGAPIDVETGYVCETPKDLPQEMMAQMQPVLGR